METEPLSRNPQELEEVPEVVILRLPQYLRVLTRLQQQGISVVSSQLLGEQLQMTPAQIRKDLSYFGRFGKQGRGYNVEYLRRELQQILGLDRDWKVVLIGMGRLGRAIISYPGFAPQGFEIVAAFDDNSQIVGQTIGGLTVQSPQTLEETVHKHDVRIAIVAVPAAHAQEVINRLVRCGVRAILNYAPVAVQTPVGVKVRNIDPVLTLQSMTYYIRNSGIADSPPAAKLA